jgi:hypothetical protein
VAGGRYSDIYRDVYISIDGTLAATLLRDARERRDANSFTEPRSLAVYDPDSMAELHYQACLQHRDNMEFAELELQLEKVAGNDPTWLLRRSSLLAGPCRWSEAEEVLRTALSQIRNRAANARDSIWLRSRMTWTQWLLSATLYARPSKKRATDFSKETVFHCNPWDDIESLRADVESAIRDRTTRSTDVVMRAPRPDCVSEPRLL